MGVRPRVPQSRRGRVLAVVLALVVLAGGGGAAWWLVADDAERYCWGAWAQPEDEKWSTTADTAPTPERRTGRCEVKVSAWDDWTVELRYGPPPKRPERRATWLSELLTTDVTLLPDGLPGVIGELDGLLVLPDRCAPNGGPPSVVTMERKPREISVGETQQQEAELLVAAANRGMEKAGCLDGRPYQLRSALNRNPEVLADTSFGEGGDYACGVPALGFDRFPGKPKDQATQIYAADRRLHSCSVWDTELQNRSFEAAMIGDPRLARLLTGMADDRPLGPGWRGTGATYGDTSVVREQCGDRSLLFLSTDVVAAPNPKTFPVYADAVARAYGCPSPVKLREAGAR